MSTFQLQGKASGQILREFTSHDWPISMSLMDYLLSLGHPIASTCLGEGVCRKCLIFPFEEWPSCQIFCFSPYPRERKLLIWVNYL